MKKLLIPVMLVALFFGLYEQSKDRPNVWITIICVIIFMYGMMRLSAKTPSKNQPNDDENAD